MFSPIHAPAHLNIVLSTYSWQDTSIKWPTLPIPPCPHYHISPFYHLRSDPKLFRDDEEIKFSRTLNSCKVPQVGGASCQVLKLLVLHFHRLDPKLFRDDIDIKFTRTLNSCKVPQVGEVSYHRVANCALLDVCLQLALGWPEKCFHQIHWPFWWWNSTHASCPQKA
jgi:hypothetical protein